MYYFLSGIIWVAIYLALVLTPLLVLLIRAEPSDSGFWFDFSMALGFAATTMMGITFALTARFRNATEPFGIDIVYYIHRRLSLIALGFTLLHVVLVFANDPLLLQLLVPTTMPGHIRAGVTALAGLLLLIGSSVLRRRLDLEYDRWRLWHILLAVTTLSLAVVHIQMVGFYVDTPWKRALWIIIPASWILFLLYRRLIKPLQLMRRPYRVSAVRRERGNAWTLVFKPEGHDGMSFMPGQFVWLSLWHTPFALREHPFSFSSSAEQTGTLEMTIKELGDYTSRIGQVRIGERAYLEGPYGAFSIDRRPAAGYVLIAGGIGIAPFMSILRTMADRGDCRPVLLLYAATNEESLTFYEELEQLKTKMNLETVYILEAPSADWTGESGRISTAMLTRHLPDEPIRRNIFVDGPVAMMESVEKSLLELGLSSSEIFVELYDIV